jgi:hypothetical protein
MTATLSVADQEGFVLGGYVSAIAGNGVLVWDSVSVANASLSVVLRASTGGASAKTGDTAPFGVLGT